MIKLVRSQTNSSIHILDISKEIQGTHGKTNICVNNKQKRDEQLHQYIHSINFSLFLSKQYHCNKTLHHGLQNSSPEVFTMAVL